jgi:hypothetical protein
MEENNRSNQKWIDQLQSLGAALFGVQSNQKHQDDCQNWTVKKTILWGIIGVLGLILSLYTVVQWVLFH